MKRSDFIKTGVLLAAGAISAPAVATEEYRKRPIRVAHITDIHVKPGIVPEAGMAAALHHAQLYRPGCDFIINTGDSIMDALEASREDTRTQWNLFTTILAKENSLPVYHAIGNHDIWGWFRKTEDLKAEAQYGKQWVQEVLALPGRYYYFDKGPWRFVVLDSTQLNPAGGYIALIDEPQMEWLKATLAATPADKYICIVSHIPILSISAGLFFNKNEVNGDLRIQRNLMHTDFFALKNLFKQYPRVKACISGHIHLQDELHYLGVTYYCNGAVSGNWWKGAFQDFEPAYAVMEFYNDGRVVRNMVNYHQPK